MDRSDKYPYKKQNKMEKTMYITLILSYEKQSYVKRLHEEFPKRPNRSHRRISGGPAAGLTAIAAASIALLPS